MKTLIVVHGFPPDAEGGSEIYVEAHARALARQFGDEVLVLTRDQRPDQAEYSVREERRDQLRIVRINNTFRHTRTFEESYQNEAVAAIARQAIDEFRPDVAHVHHLTCLSTLIVPALAERGVPLFFTLHDYWLMCHRGQLLDLDYRVCGGPGESGCARCIGRVAGLPPSAFIAARALRTLERALPAKAAIGLRHAAGRVAAIVGDPQRDASASGRRTEHMRRIAADVTRFLAPSQALRQQFIRFGTPADRILHWPYGFDRAPFEGRARDPYRGPLRLAFIGSLMVSKAPHVLIEAALRFERGVVSVDLFGAYAAYHGDDSYRRQLAPLLAADGVRHHGPVPHRGIPGALASIDVLVVPSVWPENSPLVIHEAFLAGVPVIASRTGGIPELVDDGRNGLLFEAGDVDGLHRAIARVVREPGLLDRLRDGIGPVRSIEDDVAHTRAMYETAISGTSKRRKASATPATPRIAAVVLNYRTPDDTLLAVRSLQASRRPLDEIIVVHNEVHNGVHNAATPGERPANGGVDNIYTGQNLGFSGGMNAGIRAALERGANAVLLLNSDVILPPDCVAHLEDTLEATTGCGIAGPMIASRSAPGRVTSLGMAYDAATGRMRHAGVGGHVPPRQHDRGRAAGDAARVDAVSGCVMLVRREVFDRIGLFDEDYFFSFEDLDFCLRARRAGFDTVIDRRAAAYHEGSRSIGAASPDRLYFAARNHLLLARRTTAADSVSRRVVRTSSIVMLNIAHAVRFNGGGLTRRLAAVARGTRDYFAGRVGPGPSASSPSGRRARRS